MEGERGSLHLSIRAVRLHDGVSSCGINCGVRNFDLPVDQVPRKLSFGMTPIPSDRRREFSVSSCYFILFFWATDGSEETYLSRGKHRTSSLRQQCFARQGVVLCTL